MHRRQGRRWYLKPGQKKGDIDLAVHKCLGELKVWHGQEM